MAKFSLKTLSELLLEGYNDDVQFYKDEEFVFDDGVAIVNGTVFSEWQYIAGDMWTPPATNFIYRWGDLRVEFNGVEIEGIEELITKEGRWI